MGEATCAAAGEEAPPGSAPLASTPTAQREKPAPPPRFKRDPEPSMACEKPADCPSELMRCDGGRCEEPAICLGDGDCAGRVCYRGACEDKAPGCRPQDCPEGSYCNSIFGQCEFHQCQTDEQCAGDRRCDPKGYCVECLSDADCDGNQRCHIDSHCLEPDRCTGDIDCRGLRVCDPKTTTCVDTPCLQDALEPNDTIEEAKPLAAGEGYKELVVCHENHDIFQIDLPARSGALIRILFDNSIGTVEARVRDRDKKELARYTDNTFNSALLIPFEREDEEKTYYLDVQGYGLVHSNNAPLAYSIQRYDVPGGFCVNDAFEPSDTLPDAHRITPNHVFQARLCKGDEDWYVIDLKKDETLNVYVESVFDTKHPDQHQLLPEIEVYEEGKAEPILVNTDDDGPDHAKVASVKVTRDGPYYVRLLPALIDANTHYAVRLYADAP